MNDVSYPEEGWGPWVVLQDDASDEVRIHAKFPMFERRCRWCKARLKDFPPETCQDENCLAMTTLTGGEQKAAEVDMLLPHHKKGDLH